MKDPKAGKSKNKRKSRKDGKDKEEAASGSDDDAQSKDGKGPKFPKHAESLIVNLATDSSRKEKAAWRELNATVPAVPQYLDSSDTPHHLGSQRSSGQSPYNTDLHFSRQPYSRQIQVDKGAHGWRK